MESFSKSKLTPAQSWNDSSTKQEANWTQKKMDRMNNSKIDTQPHANVAQIERVASVAIGAILTWVGAHQRSLLGAATTAVGGTLLYRGTTGNCALYKALGIDTAHGTGPARKTELLTGNTPFNATE